MAGGAHEYVAAYMMGKVGNSEFELTELTGIYKNYFDIYSEQSTSTSYNNRILGDATGEMGPFYEYYDGEGSIRNHNSWYVDFADFVESSNPWFDRSADYGNGVITSQFYFHKYSGSAINYVGFRLVVSPR